MLEGLLILAATLGLSANQVMTRTFQTKLKKTKHSINLYHLIMTASAALACFVLALANKTQFSATLILPALLFGIGFSFAMLFLAKSMETGYMSLSTVLISLSLIMPVIFSWTVLSEPIETNAVIGLVLIMATLVLSSLSSKKGERGDLKKWIIFVSVAFISNGGCMIVQKQYVSTYGKGELMMFTAMSYLFAALIFLAVYIKRNIGKPWAIGENVSRPSAFFAVAVVSGLGNVLANALLGYLADMVSGGVLYPCVHGGRAVLVAICSFLIFKEKPSGRKIAAICIGVAAIVLLNI